MGAGIGICLRIGQVPRRIGQRARRCRDRRFHIYPFGDDAPSGIGLHNGGSTTVVIMDNRTTAMTGAQQHPGTGFTLRKDPTITADMTKLAEGVWLQKNTGGEPL